MIKAQKLTCLIQQPARSGHEILHNHLLVFCNISARLSRYLIDIRASLVSCNISAWLSSYFGDIHADTAQYSTKLTCSQPVKLLHSYGLIRFVQ